MKEEERLKRIANVNLRKEEMKRLKSKRAELNKLKSNEYVKRFLKLSEELEEVQILTLEEIKKREFEKYRCSDCSHDIWFYMGGYRTEYDCGPESRDTSYREFNIEKIEFYRYRCLECYSEIEVNIQEHEKFISEHTIIKPQKRRLFYGEEFEKCRKIYFDLLFTNNTEQAYKKLMKRI